MVAIVFLHLCRVFYTGSYKAPREFNWVIGVVLLLLTLGAVVHRLPAAVGPAGVLGDHRRHRDRGLRAGRRRADALPAARRPASSARRRCIRFYVLHVAVIPAAITVLRRRALLADPQGRRPLAARRAPTCPRRSRSSPRPHRGKLEGLAPRRRPQKTKTFGVMGLVRGPFNKVGNTPDNTVYSWPNLFIAELFCFALTVAPDPGGGARSSTRRSRRRPTRPTRRTPRRRPGTSSGCRRWSPTRRSGAASASPRSSWSCSCSCPYLDRGTRGTGVWFSRHRLLGHHDLHPAPDREPRAHHHRHLLPGPELGPRHALVDPR